MIDINMPVYYQYRKLIRNMDKNNIAWNKIAFGNNDSKEEAIIFLKKLKEMYMVDEGIDFDTWLRIVNSERIAKEKRIALSEEENMTKMLGGDEDIRFNVPPDPNSSWQLYKSKLQNENWSDESIEEIEKATSMILQKLEKNSTQKVIKGLVVGHVQSGKTANMAALMAMAADWGWNTFIILSGVIENLRKQTENRLLSDLNNPGNISWVPLENLSKKRGFVHRTQHLSFDEGNTVRYFSVCLKNATRLKNMVEWMYEDSNKLRQMKIIVIDDEADQAGINTLDVEKEQRARINSLIIELVNGKQNAKPSAMNYISYTATPYANVLNETSEESLYPKDFIGVLKTSNEYFGPKQIFGVQETDDNDGLGIVNTIAENDLDIIKEIHLEGNSPMPKSLKDAISWFLVGTAIMRHQGYKKPISMLVHTSQKQSHHSNISNLIEQWLSTGNKEEILDSCELVFKEQTTKFTKDDFNYKLPNYGVPINKIKTYPLYKELVPHILDLLSKISPIKLGDDDNLVYSKGIHLCIDNCANNGINDENLHVRLAYPKNNSTNYPKPAPAFIVIGGSTLSRGLTIEGLISTYFLRVSKQGDSLMQMGRWFGYRKGYELIPRLWLTKDTTEKFEFLASLEDELRKDFIVFSELGVKPSQYGPKLMNTPKLSWLKITAKNRSQKVIETDLDFTGATSQTIIFENNLNILNHNIKVTEDFISSLGKLEIASTNTGVVFREINFETIKKDFLMKFNFNHKSRFFSQIGVFAEWFEQTKNETGMNKWNVVVSGNGKVKENEEGWEINDYKVGKISRSAKSEVDINNTLTSIGVLRAPVDLFADIPNDELTKQSIDLKSVKINSSYVYSTRKNAGLERIPQLLIYRIDKNSEANKEVINKKSPKRYNLNFDEDIIGMSIYVPGVQTVNSFAKKLTVRISDEEEKFIDEGDTEE